MLPTVGLLNVDVIHSKLVLEPQCGWSGNIVTRENDPGATNALGVTNDLQLKISQLKSMTRRNLLLPPELQLMASQHAESVHPSCQKNGMRQIGTVIDPILLGSNDDDDDTAHVDLKSSPEDKAQ